MSSILDSAKSLQEELVAIRRQLHAHPELSFCEYETSRFAQEKLSSLGFTVQSGIGKTGMIAEIGSGKTIAIRCDMDALPITELNRSMYASKIAGVMHACGHDAHVACMIGAATLLSQMDLPGRIRIILQPGEESVDDAGKSGASKMIDAGALDGVSAIIGIHVDTTVPANKVGIVAGSIMPAVQDFVIKLADTTGEDKDTPVTCAKIVLALDQLGRQAARGLDEFAISVTSIHTANDCLHTKAGQALITGKLKSYSGEKREQIQAEIGKICSDAKIEFHQSLPETVNNPRVTEIMHKAAVELIGSSNVLSINRRSWAAEFALYTELVPGSFMFLGVEIPSSRRGHHSPTFDINEGCLYIGAAILAETALRLMRD
jgi:amidohydrolase